METAKLIEGVMFWAFGLLAVAAALGVVFHRSIIYSALFLITVFLSIAGLFVLNNADFLAIAQVLIYAVGLTIIVLFSIMFTGDRSFGFDRNIISRGAMTAFSIVALYLLALLVRSVWYPYGPTGPTGGDPRAFSGIPIVGSTAEIGRLMFTQYALPFELASVLLLVAMIGAIVLSRRSYEDTDDILPKYKVLPTTALTEEAMSARMAHWQAYRHKDESTGKPGSEEETVGGPK